MSTNQDFRLTPRLVPFNDNDRVLIRRASRRVCSSAHHATLERILFPIDRRSEERSLGYRREDHEVSTPRERQFLSIAHLPLENHVLNWSQAA